MPVVPRRAHEPIELAALLFGDPALHGYSMCDLDEVAFKALDTSLASDRTGHASAVCELNSAAVRAPVLGDLALMWPRAAHKVIGTCRARILR